MFDIDRWVEIWVTITRNKTRSLLRSEERRVGKECM